MDNSLADARDLQLVASGFTKTFRRNSSNQNSMSFWSIHPHLEYVRQRYRALHCMQEESVIRICSCHYAHFGTLWGSDDGAASIVAASRVLNCCMSQWHEKTLGRTGGWTGAGTSAPAWRTNSTWCTKKLSQSLAPIKHWLTTRMAMGQQGLTM